MRADFDPFLRKKYDMQYVKIHFFQDVGVNFGVNIGVGNFEKYMSLNIAIFASVFC